MICLPNPFSQDVTVRLDIMALNLSVLNNEEPYQLRERGAPRFCLGSTTGMLPLWAPGLRGFPCWKWVCRGALSLLHSQPLLCLTWMLFPGALQRACMHVCETDCSASSQRDDPHKENNFSVFSPFHCFPHITCNFFLYLWLDTNNLCADIWVPDKAKLCDVLFSSPSAFFHTIFLFQTLKFHTVSST